MVCGRFPQTLHHEKRSQIKALTSAVEGVEGLRVRTHRKRGSGSDDFPMHIASLTLHTLHYTHYVFEFIEKNIVDSLQKLSTNPPQPSTFGNGHENHRDRSLSSLGLSGGIAES
jgi:hypothetical protein